MVITQIDYAKLHCCNVSFNLMIKKRNECHYTRIIAFDNTKCVSFIDVIQQFCTLFLIHGNVLDTLPKNIWADEIWLGILFVYWGNIVIIPRNICTFFHYYIIVGFPPFMKTFRNPSNTHASSRPLKSI